MKLTMLHFPDEADDVVKNLTAREMARSFNRMF